MAAYVGATALAVSMCLAPPLAAQELPPTAVEASKVSVETVTIEATAVGTLLSDESVIVRPEIAGRIVGIHFQEGAPVEKGQLLFALDDSLYVAELADARARLDLAKRNFERARDLLSRGAGTARARDEGEAGFETARAAVELARVRAEKSRIHAPFAGIAGLRLVSVGDYVTVGEDLVNLEAIDPVKVDFSVPERYLGSLATGQTVRVTADAFPGRQFEGIVYAMNPQIDPAGRSINVRARIGNTERTLRPGLFVRVKLELERRENAIVIPEQALIARGGDMFVYRVVDGKAVMTQVTIGQRKFGEVEILEGLSAEDTVVAAGHMKLREGAPVAPVGGATGS